MRLQIKKQKKTYYANIFIGHKRLFKKFINLYLVLTFILSTIISSLITWTYLTNKNKVQCQPLEVENIFPLPVPTVTPIKQQWTGKVSYYSKDGCLGCNKLQITASGEVFDENANTLAFNKLPLNTEVLVTNLDTGISQVAIVNDRGGFERHNRIADLSKGLFERLSAKTDITKIKIEEK